ncbi:hypothetical protein A2704_03775 [Candidatus Kaiserbacteria bacterium RIFCSPHIGHO2_01_FULL_54_36b]|uniref:Uncharacterized protein n=1 Tax=Candidatus Kaiserbacteria bacterium RIFCSPHIGHO2_01_FULL_54_36b TaxID=1798483 RepID=A0A1F6CQC9_9BACT|nr:MAG: hypothetical protein A2704_03775 [Candidatus Kaiserbacteria bacterium RIFCSPHIGHO2_01_FULL_54_36b]
MTTSQKQIVIGTALIPALFFSLMETVFTPWFIHIFLFGSIETAFLLAGFLSILPLLFATGGILIRHRSTRSPVPLAQ